MKHIGLVSAEDSFEITDLRIKEFKNARDFELLKPEQLYWNNTDEANPVIAVWDESQKIIATLRLIRVNDLRETSNMLEADIPVKVSFPGLVFNAAATRKSFRTQGFNQLLRYYCIQAAMGHKIQCLFSPVYQTAPRVAFMEKLGYSCHVFTNTWQNKLAPHCPRVLAVLEQDRFLTALFILEKAIPDLIKRFPWKGNPIHL
ncbi:MAG: hypothetical protein LC660_13295 [Desulfobacteraceae bacterium]|nr:hypothetical protein [Desulfobacteraceae bacterium]